MNIIASLTQRAPAKAEAAIEDMADLFRLMLDERKDLMPVQNEIKVARKYLKLEKLRLEQRLNANWNVHGVTRQAKTPVLMLQLLLENAIRHGIEPLPEGGNIDVDVGIVDGYLRVLVRNPVLTGQSVRHGTEEIMLDNIRLRLKDLYGDDASLRIEQSEQHFTVEIRHPAFGGVTQ
jgi:two-component system sensor histidine kinase AlgZ